MADSENEVNRTLGRLVLSIINREPVGVQMTALSDALSAMKSRIDEDVANFRRLIDEAVAANAGDDAEIERLTARADELQADIDAALTEIGNVDPDAANPPQG